MFLKSNQIKVTSGILSLCVSGQQHKGEWPNRKENLPTEFINLKKGTNQKETIVDYVGFQLIKKNQTWIHFLKIF